MKKMIMIIISAVFLSTSIFAASFSPKLLRLSAPNRIAYNFDNKPLEIPVTVSGVGAATIFCVYTKGKGNAIGKVQNGYLGWHYVNKIDTAMFISSIYDFSVGTNKIIWDGKGKFGTTVPADEYTYYLWAFDNKNPKEYASRYMTSITHNTGKQIHIQEMNEKGLPLANPFVVMQHAFNGNKAKWVIGSDPNDSSFVETCNVRQIPNWTIDRVACPDPHDFNSVYISGGLTRSLGSLKGVWKIKWVPNSAGIIDVNWGVNGFAGISVAMGTYCGPEADDNYVYWTDDNLGGYNGNKPEAVFYLFDLADGSVVKTFDLAKWWVRQEDFKLGGNLNGGPNGTSLRNGKIIFGSHISCVVQMVNPYAEKDDDFVQWTNQNGDIFFDHHFDPTQKNPWMCNDVATPPFTTSFEQDDNGFVAGAVYDIGAVSFGFIGPDGTGIANLAFAGDTASRKFYVNYVDYNSPFDGMYTDRQGSVPKASDDPGNARVVPGFMYIGHDSIKGTIGLQVAVEETAPGAFTVGQNTPNPFNPSTTINFTLAKAGKVSVDIFNVSGQRVETLVNTTMKTGSHSVTWNASHQSAGVYFCTVKSGNDMRTVKMTLIK
jgi:flagellar hook assembly protein FlgD